MKKEELIEAILAIDPEFKVDGLQKADLETALAQLGGAPTAPEPSGAPVRTVTMFRPDRGEFEAPIDDVENMLKNGWSRADGVAGEWVRRADVPRLIQQGLIDLGK